MKTLMIIVIAIFAFIGLSFVYKKIKQQRETRLGTQPNHPEPQTNPHKPWLIHHPGTVPAANNVQAQSATIPRKASTPRTVTTLVDDPSTDWKTVASAITTSSDSLYNLNLLVAKEKTLLNKSRFWGYESRAITMKPYQRLIYEVAYSITPKGMEESINKINSIDSAAIKSQLLIEKAGLQNGHLFLKEEDVENLRNLFEYMFVNNKIQVAINNIINDRSSFQLLKKYFSGNLLKNKILAVAKVNAGYPNDLSTIDKYIITIE